MRNKNFIVILTLLAIIVAPVMAVFPVSTPRAALAAGGVTLNVISARAEPAHTDPVTGDPAPVAKGAPVTTYKYIINVDNTGTTTTRAPTGVCSPSYVPPVTNPPSPAYPDSCAWTSIAGVPGSSPIYTQGTEADFASPMTLPDGR